MTKEPETQEPEDIEKLLQLALAKIDKQFGKGSVMRLGNNDIAPWPSVSTGAPTLDSALGIKGLPLGRVVEIFGPEGVGKSTICWSVIAQAQAKGLRCLFIDAEHAVDPLYARALGVDLDNLLLSQPSYGEEAIEILDQMIATGLIDVAVIDSVAALIPKAELDGDMEAQHMGLQARLMAKTMRKLVGKAREHKTLVLFTNQIREKIGVLYGNPETTPGGRALRFGASVRIDLRKKEDIKAKEDGSIIGSKVQAKIIKNKMAPPFKIAMFEILYGQGIDTIGALLDLALDAGILYFAGAWIKWSHDDSTFAQGRGGAIELLQNDQIMRKTIEEKLEK